MLCCAERALSVEEVRFAAAVEIRNDTVFDREDLLPPADILSLCPNFIEATRHEHENGQTRTLLRIAHFSVQEYLKSGKIGTWDDRARRYYVCRSRGNAEVAIAGLALSLESSRLVTLVPAMADFFEEPDEMPPYYLRHSWIVHYPKITDADDLALATNLLFRLIRDASAFAKAQIGPKYLYEDYNYPALSWAASRGFDDLLLLLLDDQTSDYGKATELDGALYLATSNGHLSTAAILVERGANIDSIVNLQTPLAAAARCGFTNLVTLLLDSGAALQVKEQVIEPLAAASAGGFSSVVSLLLDRGADVNRLDTEFGSALTAASCCGHLDTVRLLLDRGADVNANHHVLGTALMAASLGKRPDVVELLIDRGADVNAQGSLFGTALASACQDDDLPRGFVRDGLMYGPSPYFRHGGPSSTAHAQLRVVELLLGAGARLHGDGRHPSTLETAIARGNTLLARLFLRRGGRILPPGYRNMDFVAAICSGSGDTARAMLSNDSPVARGGTFRSVLASCAVDGDVHLVKALIDLDRPQRDYSIALLAACIMGHVGIVKVLVEPGAMMWLDWLQWKTSIRLACYGGHMAILELLWEYGTRHDIPVDYYDTVLYVACGYGHVEIVRFLLSRAMPTLLNGDPSPIQATLQSTDIVDENVRSEIVEMLLDAGIK